MSQEKLPARRSGGVTTVVEEEALPDETTAGPGMRRFGLSQLALAGMAACFPGDHAHMPGEGAEGHQPPGIIGKESGVAYAAAPHALAARTRVSLILTKPEGWDGNALVHGPKRNSPLIDTRDSNNQVNAGAIQAVRDDLVLTLILPRGIGVPIHVELGRGEADPSTWDLEVIVNAPLHTFGADNPISPSLTQQVLRYGGGAELGDGVTTLDFGPPQWIDGDLHPAAVGEVRNPSRSPQRVLISADPGCQLVVDGELVDADGVELPPRGSCGVVSHPDDESQTKATITVDRGSIP